jgi:hypothetical protein
MTCEEAPRWTMFNDCFWWNEIREWAPNETVFDNAQFLANSNKSWVDCGRATNFIGNVAKDWLAARNEEYWMYICWIAVPCWDVYKGTCFQEAHNVRPTCLDTWQLWPPGSTVNTSTRWEWFGCPGSNAGNPSRATYKVLGGEQ